MIKVDVASNIAVIQMDHGKANAMDLDFCCELTACVVASCIQRRGSRDSGWKRPSVFGWY